MQNVFRYLNRIIKPVTVEDFNADVRSGPLPLVDMQDRFILYFSSKAGCTFAAKWFFEQQGLLDAAIKYDKWIHRYRIHVYYKMPSYRHDLKSVLSKRVKAIKLVRCPYQRAVSSYLHCVRNKKRHDELSPFLNRIIDNDNTFTFEEFVEFLSSIDIKTCNLHYRRQTWELETCKNLKFYRVIKLENSIEEFRNIEKELGLIETNLLRLSTSNHHIKKQGEISSYCGDVYFNSSIKSIQHYSDFYNESTMDKIAQIYDEDFRNYGYSKELALKH